MCDSLLSSEMFIRLAMKSKCLATKTVEVKDNYKYCKMFAEGCKEQSEKDRWHRQANYFYALFRCYLTSI
jgi:hypothetical protein